MNECNWNMLAAILTTVGGLIVIYGFFKGGIEKLIQRQTDTLHKDILSLKEDIKDIKEDIKTQSHQFEQQSQRIDRLYNMFVELLKERNLNTKKR